LKNLKRHD
jgi:hypothetical protein